MEEITTGQELHKVRKELDLTYSQLARIIKINREKIVWAEQKHPKRKLSVKMYKAVNNSKEIAALYAEKHREVVYIEWIKNNKAIEKKATLWERIKTMLGLTE